MPPRAMDDVSTGSSPTLSKSIKRVGSMGNISVEANEKPSNVYTTRKSTLIGYVKVQFDVVVLL